MRQILATDKTAWLDADSKLFFREYGPTAAQKAPEASPRRARTAAAASNGPASGQSDAGTPTGRGAGVSGGLQPGRFYLRIDNVGYGDPLNTGYSTYGSRGAYTLGVSPS